MRVKGRYLGTLGTARSLGIVALGAAAGCCSPQTCGPEGIGAAPIVSGDPAEAVQAGQRAGSTVIVESPRSGDAQAVVAFPSTIETWVVHTRACEQKGGSNPWPAIAVGRFDEQGGPLHGTDPEALIARMNGRPAVILIHGNGYLYRESIEEAVKVRAQLEALGGLPQETVFIIFDWPSERTDNGPVADLNEKSRRSGIAGYHLARFLQTAPVDSRICLMGQSDGGRIALTTMHLLAGAVLPAFWSSPATQLSSARPDLRFRAVILDTAAGHHWLNPDERLDHALGACEALLNLRNSGDYALALYNLGLYTGIRPAIGRVGLRPSDARRIGPLASRVEQYNVNPTAGHSHTTFPQVLGTPGIAERIAGYTAWRDVSGASRHGRSTVSDGAHNKN